jgi:hypothetical protein
VESAGGGDGDGGGEGGGFSLTAGGGDGAAMMHDVDTDSHVLHVQLHLFCVDP